MKSDYNKDAYFYTEDLYNVSLNLYSVGKKYCSEKWNWGPVLSELYTLHYIQNGSAVYMVNGKHFPIKKGDIVLIFPNTISFIETDGSPYKCYWMNFNGINVKDLLKNTDFMPDNPVISVQDDLTPFIENALCGKGLLPYQQSHMVGYLYIVLSLIMKSSSSLSDKNSLQKEYILNATQYISQKYSEHITVVDVAKHVGISPSHLYRVFKSELNITPNEYITNFRIEKSLMLMKRPELTISMISDYVGINDPLYFSKVFSSHFGIPPTEYRKLKLEI